MFATAPERTSTVLDRFRIPPERVSTSELKFERVLFVATSPPERVFIAEVFCATIHESEEIVLTMPARLHEREFTVLSRAERFALLVLRFPERVFTVPERASCAREAVK